MKLSYVQRLKALEAENTILKELLASMTPDGFFKSGDVGIMDERGYVRIVDRKKDMILVSGFTSIPTRLSKL